MAYRIMVVYLLIIKYPNIIMKTIQIAALTATLTMTLLFANIDNVFAEKQTDTLHANNIEMLSVEAAAKPNMFSYAFKVCTDGEQHQQISKIQIFSDIQTKFVEMTNQSEGCFTSVTSIKATSPDEIYADNVTVNPQMTGEKTILEELRMDKFQQFDSRKQIISQDTHASDIRNALNENAKHTMNLLLAMRATVLLS